jgi:hypothetical protein
MLEAELILKTTPPRLPAGTGASAFRRTVEAGQRSLGDGRGRPGRFRKDDTDVAVAALWLERGSHVAWATLDAQDEPARFARCLLNACAAPPAAPPSSRSPRCSPMQPDREMEAMTAMLAEIAGLGIETVLMLDDAERMPASSSHLLAYLMHNAPPNLHLVVGSRVPLAVATAELSAKGNLALLQPRTCACARTNRPRSCCAASARASAGRLRAPARGHRGLADRPAARGRLDRAQRGPGQPPWPRCPGARATSASTSWTRCSRACPSRSPTSWCRPRSSSA